VIASGRVETFEREIAVACALAREAGAIIMRHYGNDGIAVETKPDQSPVTAADKEADAAIVAGLRAAFPGDAVLTEESPDDRARLANPRVWMVDPLDGTRDFLARTGDFCVHIGLALHNQAALGVVYQPVADGLYFARSGGGAFLEQQGETRQLHTSSRSEAGELKVGVSRLALDVGLEKCLLASGLAPRAMRLGGSVKHMALARGDLDAVLNLSPGEQEWDTCAPEVIMREAGGTITDGDGRPFRYNQENLFRPRGSVASNGRCHPLMLRVIAPCLPVPP
jgi:3'(2'), 5'-bisphosphate nucleotidase